MNAFALAASLLSLTLAPAVTAHGDTLTFAASLPSGTWHAFELALRDSLVWQPTETIMIRFPHSAMFAFEQAAIRVDGSPQRLGTLLDRTRGVTVGDVASLPAASLESRAREDGRRSVTVFAKFPGAFSADSLVRVTVGRLQREGAVRR